ncbi:MAG: energy transducer TonB [Prevotellaceae bacterium]|jgi:TonB family protein|nr:energy transducer TonB [Prevotellaceae bacterium]
MKNSDTYASIGTVVICILILLLLFLFRLYLPSNYPPEGIEVMLGDNLEGFGSTSPAPQRAEPSEVTPDFSRSTPTPPNNLMTQTNEAAIKLAEAEKQKQREQELKERMEQERLQKEAAEKKKREEEKAKTDRANNAMSGVFGQSGDGSGGSGSSSGGGQGNSTGNSTQGNPVGSGTYNGHNWSLNGRQLVSGIPQPAYTQNVEGRITVEIRVDENGRVTDVTIKNSVTNITDEKLRNSTMEAAKKVKFSSGNGIAVGTLTYNFKLN